MTMTNLRDDLFDAALQFGRSEKCCNKLLVEVPIDHPDHLRAVATSRLLDVCREITAAVDNRPTEPCHDE